MCMEEYAKAFAIVLAGNIAEKTLEIEKLYGHDSSLKFEKAVYDELIKQIQAFSYEEELNNSDSFNNTILK